VARAQRSFPDEDRFESREAFGFVQIERLPELDDLILELPVEGPPLVDGCRP
jgi:hypothetical protein